MKVLVLSELYPPFFVGGYELNCEFKVKGLEGRGHEMTVLTSMHGVGRRVREGNVYRYMHSLASESCEGMSRRLAQLKNACIGRINYRIAKRVAEEVKPDVAYVWRMGNVSIFPVLAVCERKIPVVYELEDYWLLRYRNNFVREKSALKRLYRKVLFGGFVFERLDFTNMIMVSGALKKSYDEGQFCGGNITVIPGGVSKDFVIDERFVKRMRAEGEIRLLFAGRIVEVKGVHVAVKAVRHLLDHLPTGKFKLDIIGNGNEEYVKELERLIRSLDLGDRVRFGGPSSHHDLMNMYKNYDVFLFPSVWEEPLGMTIIEAMAKGVPVVASRVGGVPEIIDDGRNGLLVAPGDPEEIANAVKRLLDDPNLYISIRAGGIRTVLERFSYDAIAGNTEKYFHDIVREKSC